MPISSCPKGGQKMNHGGYLEATASAKEPSATVHRHLKKFKSKMYLSANSNKQVGNNASVHNRAYKFHKSDVNSLEFIAQVENKFILCKTSNYIVAIDQHAADERIHLERYLNRYRNGLRFAHDQENSNQRVSEPLLESIREPRISQAMLKWGWRLKVTCDSIIVQSSPEILGTIVDHRDVGIWIESVSNNPTCIPSIAKRILASKACRHSVKFGEGLNHEESQQLIEKLKSCRFPFQCAHGRPTMTVLWELKQSFIRIDI